MDFFYVAPMGSSIVQGAAINDIVSATWIERYNRPGEFTLKTPVSSGLREVLFTGRLISHIDTLDVGVILDHEIDENTTDAEPLLIITGQMITSRFDSFSIGQNIDWDAGGTGPPPEFVMAPAASWIQARNLLRRHLDIATISATGGMNDNDGWYGVEVEAENNYTITTAPDQNRIVKRGKLDARLAEILAVDDFGVRFKRTTSGDTEDPVSHIIVHNGYDRSAEVIFSYASGDLVNPRYFWSERNYRSHAHIVSKWFEVRFGPGPDPATDDAPYLAPWNFYRRTEYVDASDLDDSYDTAPTGTTKDDIIAAMKIRGLDVVTQAKYVSLVSTDISVSTKYQYRRDYDIGDIVSVEGNYGIGSKMRVTEHVEFQDENGESGYPTLSIIT